MTSSGIGRAIVRLKRRLRLRFRREGVIEIVILGRFWPRWRRALEPGAAVWPRLPDVQNVIAVADIGELARVRPRAGTRRVVIPLLEEHIRALPLPCFVLAPTPEVLEQFADKAQFARYVERTGLAALTPRLYADADQASYPCVLKRLDLHSGQGIALLADRTDYDATMARAPWSGQKVLLQEFVEGATDHVLHAVYRDGAPVWWCAYQYLFTHSRPIRAIGDNGQRARHVPSAETLAALTSFLSPIGYSGPVNIDFKYRPDGKVAVLEINPRLGGSLMWNENLDDLTACLAAIIEQAHWMSADEPAQ